MPQGIDIRPDHLQVLVGVLRRHLSAAEVWVFGSRINGQSHPASDLDLVVRSRIDLREPHGDIAKLRQALRDSSLPFLIDLHDWARLPESFRNEIAEHHLALDFDPEECEGTEGRS